MARALMAALRFSGHEVGVASALRLFLAEPDAQRQADLAATAAREVEVIAERWRSGGTPDVWFTYHNHFKAPDLLGPGLTRHFALPYVVAEASHAPKRAATWTSWHDAAEFATRRADAHLCFTLRDQLGIAPLVRPGARTSLIHPFIEMSNVSVPPTRTDRQTVRLVATAMMRPGEKLESYRFLAQALQMLTGPDWHLDVIGDGSVRAEVEAAFAPCGSGRVTWHGMQTQADVMRLLGKNDVFVWPGFGEAFGLAYLEAQAMGLPVVALDVAGVGAVVRNGETGLLVQNPMPSAFAAAIQTLVHDVERRTRLGEAAARFVRTERTLSQAADVLDQVLCRVMEEKLELDHA